MILGFKTVNENPLVKLSKQNQAYSASDVENKHSTAKNAFANQKH